MNKALRKDAEAIVSASIRAVLHDAAVFSVGSDGTDGPTEAAGGYMDGDTLAALKAAGMDVFYLHKTQHSWSEPVVTLRTGSWN